MDKKWEIIGVLILAILVVLFLLLSHLPNLSPEQESNLETCNSLSYSSSSATNLVFIATESQTQEYFHYLTSSSPYSQDSFNTYYIDYKPECELYQQKAVLCYNEELVKKASSCPNDVIIVIQSQPSTIRSSSYMNVVSINSNNNKNVILHELGHALAFLADEYVPATLPRKSENCQKTCNFQQCFQGCSKEDYFRSIDNGVMKTLSSSDYGDVNENLILKQISKSSSITGNIIQDEVNCEKQEYYLIQARYENDNIITFNKSVETGCIGNNGMGDFSYNLVMSDNSTYSENFNPELIFTDSDESGEVLASDREFFLKIPIITNSKSLEIIKETKLAEINLQDIDSRPCKI